jgi:dUTP pyrophosphatase
VEIKIARIRDGVELPRYVPESAACFDFQSAVDLIIKPNEVVKVPSGLIIQVPPGFMLCVAPRSSAPEHGISMPHSFGIIDPTYCGPEDEVLIQIQNRTKKPIQIKRGQRIAQGFFLETPKVIWKEVAKDELAPESRGGFGSTGAI